MTSLSPERPTLSPTPPPEPPVPRDVSLPERARARPGRLSDLSEIFLDFWRYRELLVQLARRDIRIRYKQAVMGFAWAILMPMVVVGAGILVRYAMATISHMSLNLSSIAGLAVKSLPWSFFVGSLGFSVASLTGNSNLVAKIYFPREVLPLSVTLAQGFDTLIGTIMVSIMVAVLGVSPSWQLLWVPVLVVLLFCVTLAVGLFVSCANLFFRDVKYIVQVLVTFGIFFTPVFFEPTMFGPIGAPLMMLNPLAPLVEGFRVAIIDHHNLLMPLVTTTPAGASVMAWSPWYLAYAVLWAFGGLASSLLLFHRLEFVFAEYL
ncbi:MAG TPA: ABC transporter permease [Gemmatimonadales bacterium]|nr:ABC transporter permease [Gemmatimonadales bacterium]